jgi:hypothetical protein
MFTDVHLYNLLSAGIPSLVNTRATTCVCTLTALAYNMQLHNTSLGSATAQYDYWTGRLMIPVAALYRVGN